MTLIKGRIIYEFMGHEYDVEDVISYAPTIILNKYPKSVYIYIYIATRMFFLKMVEIYKIPSIKTEWGFYYEYVGICIYKYCVKRQLALEVNIRIIHTKLVNIFKMR